ncbi:DUF4901 domain-containing protein [Paenibacillus urinalis]|uniref:DUF4901 domain-containing protein n=1 Tax=Paenibacillus urinalis TaxID=521520 RepID=A0AAX3N7Q8_9BACL|nr:MULTISPECIES: YcdB/YcdC domain-containing protein [Paenibacillus]WDH84734.1 DUF4901 domain-containing protein [Paenibacillus urinalis]WDH96193.1 DUF4901 domain-containing protein [Paenibacillus urinalis]WDI04416.1 DUF4901 domain-containing protein [Paenibacillus urinalis]GAK42991.1 hypothetical protein TCA2_5485 [Paenibacillus sp. TCA20]
MDYDHLRRLAEKYADPPTHYTLVMEDSIPKENAQYRVFVWENSDNVEETIEVDLDLHSKELLRLQKDRQAELSSFSSPSDRSVKDRAQEMLEQYLQEPDRYMFNEIKYIEDKVKVDYRLQIGGLPLPHTGCEFIFTRDLDLFRFRFEGNKSISAAIPHWPHEVIEPDMIRANLLSAFDMELRIQYFYSTIYDYQGSDSTFKLVYTAVPERQIICAVTGEDLFDKDHYRLPRSEPMVQAGDESFTELKLQCETVSDSIDSALKKWEERLGIDLSIFEREEMKDEEGEIRCLYALRNQNREMDQDAAQEPNPLQTEAYFKHRWGKIFDRMIYSCKLSIDKNTSRLLAFHAFEQEGETETLQEALGRSACREIAELFLADVFPEHGALLHREMDSDLENEEPSKKEFFFYPLFMSGIQVAYEQVMIVVNTRNGRISSYRGISPHLITELMSVEHQPKLTTEEAYQRYSQKLDVQLKWFLHTASTGEKEYKLVYEPVVKYKSEAEVLHTRTVYIDANSGEWIYRKE